MIRLVLMIIAMLFMREPVFLWDRKAPFRFDEHKNHKKNSEPTKQKMQNKGHRRQRIIMDII